MIATFVFGKEIPDWIVKDVVGESRTNNKRYKIHNRFRFASELKRWHKTAQNDLNIQPFVLEKQGRKNYLAMDSVCLLTCYLDFPGLNHFASLPEEEEEDIHILLLQWLIILKCEYCWLSDAG